MSDEADPAAEHGTSGLVSGLLNSLAQLAATLLSMLSTRVELASVELQEHLRHVVNVLLWSLLVLFALCMGCLLVAVVVIIAYWDTHRLLAAICVTGAFFLLAALAALVVLNKVRNHPRLLQGTLEELKRDQDWLRNRQ